MSSFILKIIGIVTMLCDHSGDTFIGYFSLLNLIGRIAFPIFAFQIVQGYIHTSNFKKYAIRLLIFACISQIPFMLFLSIFYNGFYLNIFFSLFLGVVALYVYDKTQNRYIGLFFVALICILAYFLNVDYGSYAILVIFTFYIFKNNKINMFLCFICLTILKYIPNIISTPTLYITYINCILFTCISLIPIYMYNGKQGLKIKYLFYTFYPLHLLILWLIKLSLT